MREPYRFAMLSLLATSGILIAAAAIAASDKTPPLHTVPSVDLKRYTGRWYEVARYPNRFEKKCERDITANYSLNSGGSIRVVNICVNGEGKEQKASGTAKIADAATNAKLKVTFFWPFYGNYWIVELGDDYDYAVIGEPSRKYLWILSRTPSIDPATYQGILARLPDYGYDPQKLINPPHSAASTAENN